LRKGRKKGRKEREICERQKTALFGKVAEEPKCWGGTSPHPRGSEKNEKRGARLCGLRKRLARRRGKRGLDKGKWVSAITRRKG